MQGVESRQGNEPASRPVAAVAEKQMMGYRIAPVDGLRAVAALGVVWAHIWQGFHNVSWSVGHIGHTSLNLNQPISTVGTGVDLFFVISGFCMYLMYSRRQSKFELGSYVDFLKRRWLRIAPAFYAAALAVAVGLAITGRPFPLRDFVTNITFTQHYFPHANDLVAPFWSLATEWGFYLVLPLCTALSWRWGFWRTMLLLGTVCLLFRVYAFEHFPLTAYSNVDWNWSCFILFRLIEFVWGMCVARFVVERVALPRMLRGVQGLVVVCVVSGIGRVMTTHFTAHAGHLVAVGIAALSTPLLTLGYALLLWNTIESQSVVRRFLCTRPMQLTGRWSYSLYLWHAYPVAWISEFMVSRFGDTAAMQYLAFAIAVAVLLPISALSFRLFERPYFRHRQPQAVPPIVVAGAATSYGN